MRCKIKKCRREIVKNGSKSQRLCARCYRNWREWEDERIPPCAAPDCPRRGAADGVHCGAHYSQIRRWGSLDAAPGRGSPGVRRGPRALTGSFITKNGYRKIRLDDGRWMLEHRHVMEQRLGRPLVKGENVHHKNGRKLDNKDSNLELWVKSQPTGQRVEDLLEWAHEIIHRYEDIAA